MPDSCLKCSYIDGWWLADCFLNRLIKTGLLLFLFCSALWSQNESEHSYLVEGRIIVAPGFLGDVKARCIVDHKSQELPVDENGAFFCRLGWNRDYLFEFLKPGYITKSVRFSTHVPNNTDKSTIQPFLLMVKLFPVMKGVDTAYFRNPVGFVRFSRKINDFEPVTDYDLLVKYNNELKEKLLLKSGNLKNKKLADVGADVGHSGESNTHSGETKHSKREPSLPELSNRLKKITPTEAYRQFLKLDVSYKEGITMDTLRLGAKTIFRYVVVSGKKRSVFLEVIHDWGPTFFFISNNSYSYRCISRNSFENCLYQSR